MREERYELEPIGWVESPIADRASAPRQGDEGAPEAWLMIEPTIGPALGDLLVGQDVIVLTWLDRARRDVLVTHPRDDPTRAACGVFSTRSADRPNPIGLHHVKITAIEGTRLRVGNLEALNQTPVLDIKPVLEPTHER
ncbi:MAG: tRNA (adenine(37)-N6)-methyltransferase [uncultured Acidimicrobiales bacterium]|uniref:tRNA (Adenine(37)-N6)-methyltransferase n=1 Tax=uncultured Acidimicrobiales bacterium TaxID=310071 RepID=A0A6J4HE07_9ACTN|nr:MAG: tRNA (adenine(37)-N6)-methyltransferase [uncultured Acidimicrobiales bacterium]